MKKYAVSILALAAFSSTAFAQMYNDPYATQSRQRDIEYNQGDGIDGSGRTNALRSTQGIDENVNPSEESQGLRNRTLNSIVIPGLTNQGSAISD